MAETTTVPAPVELWEETTVRLKTRNGDQDVPAIIHPRTPGLAVTMFAFGYFDITHVPTGRRIAGPWVRAGGACLAVAGLAQCADWLRGDLAEQMKTHGDESAEIDGCTVTERGVKRPMTKREFIQSVQMQMLGDDCPWEDESPGRKAIARLATLPAPAAPSESSAGADAGRISEPIDADGGRAQSDG